MSMLAFKKTGRVNFFNFVHNNECVKAGNYILFSSDDVQFLCDKREDPIKYSKTLIACDSIFTFHTLVFPCKIM